MYISIDKLYLIPFCSVLCLPLTLPVPVSALPFPGLKASLQRLQLEYVDVVFANRPDNNTPMEGQCQLQLKGLMCLGLARGLRLGRAGNKT